MIRVALFVQMFPSPEHPYILDWAKCLAKSGVDLIVYAEQEGAASMVDEDRGFWERVQYLNSLQHPLASWRRNFFIGLVNLFNLPRAAKILWEAHPGKPLSVLRKLYEYMPLWGETFDIVHFNAPQLAIRRFELGRLLSARTLVSFRGQDFSFDATRFTPLLQQADHLHFISNHLIELANAQGYDGRRHTLIPPLVDLDFYRPTQHLSINREQHDSWTLFSAGRFTWVKGWEFALQAFALLVQKGWNAHYFIAGDGEMRDAVVYTIHELNLQERVHLLGWLSAEKVRDWMQKSDLYLLASVNEAFNNSVLQAQACGLPVVCSDSGGLPENIRDGVTGLLYHCRDSWDMAAKIEDLLSNPEMRLNMGHFARQRAQACFSLDAGVQAFTTLYQRLI